MTHIDWTHRSKTLDRIRASSSCGTIPSCKTCDKGVDQGAHCHDTNEVLEREIELRPLLHILNTHGGVQHSPFRRRHFNEALEYQDSSTANSTESIARFICLHYHRNLISVTTKLTDPCYPIAIGTKLPDILKHPHEMDWDTRHSLRIAAPDGWGHSGSISVVDCTTVENPSPHKMAWRRLQRLKGCRFPMTSDGGVSFYRIWLQAHCNYVLLFCESSIYIPTTFIISHV
jgi:hypothetical protein